MAIDPLQTVTTEPTVAETSPKMLRRPADAPSPFDPVRANENLRTLHEGWARLYGHPSNTSSSPTQWQRVRGKLRRSLPFGAADRELIGVLIRTVDALAQRCDEIAERLSVQESLTEDVTASFGEDITHLRADLIQVRTNLQEAGPPDQ